MFLFSVQTVQMRASLSSSLHLFPKLPSFLKPCDTLGRFSVYIWYIIQQPEQTEARSIADVSVCRQRVVWDFICDLKEPVGQAIKGLLFQSWHIEMIKLSFPAPDSDVNAKLVTLGKKSTEWQLINLIFSHFWRRKYELYGKPIGQNLSFFPPNNGVPKCIIFQYSIK